MPCLPWAGWPGRKRDSATRRVVLFLPEAEAPGMGPGISFGSGVSDADGGQHAGSGRDRCARLIPQLCQVAATRRLGLDRRVGANSRCGECRRGNASFSFEVETEYNGAGQLPLLNYRTAEQAAIIPQIEHSSGLTL